MPSYDFEVWQGDSALHRVTGVELERLGHAWSHIRKLTKRYGAPGRRIAVRDEQGDIAILVGAQTAKRLFAERAA